MAEDAPLPPPPVPPECNLRGLEWMPWHGQRVADSTFNAHATDAEFRAGARLWWASWTQVPASSLPDDDAVLAHLAGFGRDVAGWRKVRARALHGFEKHSDGRLYHRVLAPLAREAWKKRLGDRARKAKGRTGKAAGTGADADGDTDATGTGRGRDADTTRTAASDPRPVQRERRGEERTGDERNLEAAPFIPRADQPVPANPTGKADALDSLPDDAGWGADQEDAARDWAQHLAERGEDTPARLRKGAAKLAGLHADGQDIREVVDQSIMTSARGISGLRGPR